MEARGKYIYIIAFIVIVIAGIMVYYFYRKPSKSAILIQKTEEAIYKRLSAEQIMKTETAKSFDILRQSANDESYPRLQRGLTIAYIADVFMNKTNRKPSFGAKYIFIGDPYVSFLNPAIPDEDYRTAEGIRLIYEYSLTFADLPVSYFRVAQWHVNRALEGGEMRAISVSQANDYLKKGDSVLARTQRTPRLSEAIGYAFWLKGLVLGDLAAVEGKPELKIQAEESFKKSLEILSKSVSKPLEGEMHSLWARLYYAMFLHTHYGNNRADDIKVLLGDIVTSPHRLQFSFNRYLDYLGEINPSFFDVKREKEQVASLALYNTDFAAMLKELGWTL